MTRAQLARAHAAFLRTPRPLPNVFRSNNRRWYWQDAEGATVGPFDSKAEALMHYYVGRWHDQEVRS